MTALERASVNRRRIVAAGGAAALLGLAGNRKQASADSVRTGGGIAGGGWLDFGPSEAQFSVFGSTFVVEESDEPVIFGSFNWADAAGFTLTSSQVVSYGPDRADEQARVMTGFVTHSETEKTHAFRLRLTDGGGPGEELDMIELLVGGEVEASAEVPEIEIASAMVDAKGKITVGDLQLLTFEFTGK